MDINKEREVFECWFRTTATYKTLWDFISTHQTNIKSVFVKRNGKTYQNDCVQIAWSAWQAAKAQAVPEWFDYTKQSPRIDGRYQILISGEQITADWQSPFGFSDPIAGEALIQDLISHWGMLPEPPEPQEPAND